MHIKIAPKKTRIISVFKTIFISAGLILISNKSPIINIAKKPFPVPIKEATDKIGCGIKILKSAKTKIKR